MSRRNIRKTSGYARSPEKLSEQTRALAEDVSKLVDVAPQYTVLARLSEGIGAIERVTLAELLGADTDDDGAALTAVTIRLEGVDSGTRQILNLHAGTGITLAVADDAANTEVDITITNSSPGVTDHGALTGLADDDHTQYLLLAGRAGGQTARGGTAASENLNLLATAHATKGYITLDGLRNKLATGDVLWVDATRRSAALGSGTTTGAGNVTSATAVDTVAIGHRALDALSSGANNIAIGSDALGQCNTGTDNIAIGTNAILITTSGSNNIAIGTSAMDVLSNGTNNVGVGYSALSAVFSGTHNIAIGTDALDTVRSGSNNVGIGRDAGKLCADTSAQNVIIGALAADALSGTSTSNTFIGYDAGGALTGALHMVVIGGNALDAGTGNTSADSVVIGVNAVGSSTSAAAIDAVIIGDAAAFVMQSNTGSIVLGCDSAAALTTGNYNTLIGFGVAPTLTTGRNNVVIGAYEDTSVYADVSAATKSGQIVIAAEEAVEASQEPAYIVVADDNVFAGGYKPGNWKTSSGAYNTAIGRSALRTLTDGPGNTGIGYAALGAVTTGDYNLGIGYAAGGVLQTGDNNIFIGKNLDAPANNTSNYLVLGGAIFGDLSGLDIRIGGSGAVSQTERLAVTDSNADTVGLVTFETTGSNGAKVRFFVGTQDPSGTITATGGDIYFRVNGASSKTYQNTTAGSGTTWTAMF